MVDQSSLAVKQLLTNLQLLKSSRAQIELCSAASYLQRSPQRFDIVFLDPPFQPCTIENYCTLLESGGWLAAHAIIYMERKKGTPAPQLPAEWQLQREKQAGKVTYMLAIRGS